ncbi:MAG: PPC domain-containing DNA-binding protein [Planctomycetota bacterium]|jgi:predicted DNA-binding protein with PD1-like motif
MRHHHFGDGRYVLRLDPGEDLLAVLAAFAAEEDVQAGHVTGLGSLDKLTLGFLDPDTNEYAKRRFDERMEVGQLTGTFSMDGDRPFVHVHAVVAPRELLAYSGHVHAATVGALMELFVTSYPDRLERLPVEGQPFPGLFLPGERPSGESSSAR